MLPIQPNTRQEGTIREKTGPIPTNKIQGVAYRDGWNERCIGSRLALGNMSPEEDDWDKSRLFVNRAFLSCVWLDW